MPNIKGNMQYYECQWIITNFKARFCDTDNYGRAHSMLFSNSSNRSINWHFRLYTDEMSSTMTFQIVQEDNPYYSVKSPQPYLHIINSHGERIELIDASMTYSTKSAVAESNTWTFYKFSKKLLLEKVDLYLPNNQLAVICCVCIEFNADSTISPCYQIGILKNIERKNFENFIKNDELSDVTVMVNGKEFRVRKELLTGSSPVFAAMFRYDMKERNENRVIIDEMETEVFVGMMEYIYANHVTDIDKIAIGLLAAADRYAIEGLRMVCQQSIFRHITIDNIEEIFMLADRYNAKQLMQYYTKYFMNPPLVRIIKYCDAYFDKSKS